MYVFRNVVDLDYSSLYPSINDSHNIAITTQWGKLFIGESVSTMENPYDFDRYDRGGNFIDDFQTGHINMIGVKWFGLPTISEIIDIMDSDEEYKSDDGNRDNDTVSDGKGFTLKLKKKGFSVKSKPVGFGISLKEEFRCIGI